MKVGSNVVLRENAAEINGAEIPHVVPGDFGPIDCFVGLGKAKVNFIKSGLQIVDVSWITDFEPNE